MDAGEAGVDSTGSGLAASRRLIQTGDPRALFALTAKKAEGSAAHKGKTPSREKRSTREERLAKKRPSTRERRPAREECLTYKKCISPEKDIAQKGAP